MQEQHFNKVFWLLTAAFTAAILYIYLITFVSIPKDNIRFADTAQGFLLGTVIGGIISYFAGGSPVTAKKNDALAATGSITGELKVEPGITADSNEK